MDARAEGRNGSGGGHRLFLALWPDEDVRTQLVAAIDRVDAFREAGRRVAPAKLHLTLHFLGGWPGRPDDVIARVEAMASAVEAQAFHLVIDHAGSFAGARVGWLAPAGNSGLDALWSALGRGLEEADIQSRRHERFSPHVTALRDFRERLSDVPVEPVSWPVHEFILVHSHDGRYDVLHRWPLAGA